MKLVNGNIIDFTLEERGDHGLYDVKMYVNMVPYIGVYSFHTGFIFSSLEDELLLEDISNEIESVLRNET